MFHNIFQKEELSKYFKIAKLIALSNLICKTLQMYYLPQATTLHAVIQNISNATFIFIAYVIISQLLIYLEDQYNGLYKKNFFIFIIISTFVTTSTFFLLLLNKFIKFYLYAFTHIHNPKMIYLLISILIILLFDLYSVYNKTYFINENFTQNVILKTLKSMLYKCTFIGIFYIYFIDEKNILAMAQNYLNLIKMIFFIYIETYFYIVITLWILFSFRFIYKKIMY